MDEILFHVGRFAVTVEVAMVAGAAVVGLLLVALFIAALRGARARAADSEAAQLRGEEMDRRLAGLMQVQSEMTGRVSEMSGRMQTMAEIFGTRTSDLQRAVNERLDSQGQRLGQAMAETRTKTEESLGKLNERLAVIDRAQSSIRELAGEVVSLQSILSNKQTRGAFGQGRMEAIIGDGLPPGRYAFQQTLSNNRRPDCVVFMPNNTPPLVIDAKFPLESWQRLSGAESEDTRFAQASFRQDMSVHIKAISENYLIPGETQDTAFLFVPSESIFADIHEHFEDVVQRANRARVVIVSPSILMLSIQVIQALLRDVRMREEAHRIQKEVTELLGDLGRLGQRVDSLQQHFRQANKDIDDIVISSKKIAARGDRIEAMEFDEPERLAGE